MKRKDHHSQTLTKWTSLLKKLTLNHTSPPCGHLKIIFRRKKIILGYSLITVNLGVFRVSVIHRYALKNRRVFEFLKSGVVELYPIMVMTV